MNKLQQSRRNRSPKFLLIKNGAGVLTLVSIGAIARIAASRVGNNYDFNSYLLVVEARHQGLTPWQTGRYNYGPVWAQLLCLFDRLSSVLGISFRLQVILMLTLADFVIAIFIAQKKGRIFGWIFYFNPVSILISGYHNQFDNLAIALICVGIMAVRDHNSSKVDVRDIVFLLTLGLSLSTKHVFLIFVIWAAVKQKSFAKKLLYLSAPLVVFVGLFVPYLNSSWDPILKTVVKYRSFDNAPLWSILGLEDGIGPITLMMIFAGVLTVIGLVTTSHDLHHSLFVYVILVVAFSPAVANQYLAIPLVGVVGLINAPFILYVIYTSYWLVINVDGFDLGTKIIEHTTSIEGPLRILVDIRLLEFLNKTGYGPMTILLILGIANNVFRRHLRVSKFQW